MPDSELPGPRGLARLRATIFAGVPETVYQNWLWDVLAGLCSGIYQGAVWTFALQLARGKLHASGFEMGLATAAPATGYLFAIFWARQMEGKSKLPFVTVTWVVSRGLFLLTPLAVRGSSSGAAFITLLCLAPIIFSVSTPAYTAIMKDIYPDHLRGRLMSYVRVGMWTAMLVTARLMGNLQEHHGLDFRWMFAFGGVFGVGTALAFSRLRLPECDPNARTPSVAEFFMDSLNVLRRNAGYRWFCVSVFVTGFANLLQVPAQYVVQVDRFHITPTQIATMQNLAGGTSMLSLFFWGWYMDRYGSLVTVLVGVCINCMAPLIYAFAPSLSFLYLAAVAMGVSASGIDLGYLNTTLMFAEPGRAAQYQAIHSTLFGLRGTIAPLLTFRVAAGLGGDWRLFFCISVGIMAVGTGFQYFSMRSYRRVQLERLVVRA
jgi:MFS family permease